MQPHDSVGVTPEPEIRAPKLFLKRGRPISQGTPSKKGGGRRWTGQERGTYASQEFHSSELQKRSSTSRTRDRPLAFGGKKKRVAYGRRAKRGPA